VGARPRPAARHRVVLKRADALHEHQPYAIDFSGNDAPVRDPSVEERQPNSREMRARRRPHPDRCECWRIGWASRARHCRGSLCRRLFRLWLGRRCRPLRGRFCRFAEAGTPQLSAQRLRVNRPAYVLKLPAGTPEHPGAIGDYLPAWDFTVVFTNIDDGKIKYTGAVRERDITGSA